MALVDTNELRELFLKYLTVDSETKDRRRKEFNQGIFDEEEGWAVFCGTNLEMVMEKFDRAVKEVEKK
jgi:hypothetical protein